MSDDLRYPIGKFDIEGPITSERLRQWIGEIAAAPAQLRAAVAGLTDAQLDTSVSRRIKKENAPAPAAAPAAPGVRMLKMKCPICSVDFNEPVDSKGRVDCPSCYSSFSA